MKLGVDMWALIDPDGTIAGDGESPAIGNADFVGKMALALRYQDRQHLRLVRCVLIQLPSRIPAEELAHEPREIGDGGEL